MHKNCWHAKLITLFPEMFLGPLGFSCAGHALKKGLWHLQTIDLRLYGVGHHKNVDGKPCGGGAGMIIRPDVMAQALDDAMQGIENPRIVYFSPRGRTMNQKYLQDWANNGQTLIGICGRYEGLDQRVLDAYNVEEMSLGDYILSGGEIAAMALIEGVVRLIPGVMGNDVSKDDESFTDSLLEYPQYTKPVCWKDRHVPEVLLSGHHNHINQWRLEKAEKITQDMRPDLWAQYKKHAKIHKN